MAFDCEECWTLVGERRGRIWLGRRVRRSKGRRAAVAFDAQWVLRREERRGDVIGFYHTHPPGCLFVSARDARTMRAWCGAFGKPLLCAIQSGERLAAWRFEDDECSGKPLAAVELFARDNLAGVDHDGGGDGGGKKISSRGTLPRQGAARETRRPARRAVRRRRAGL